MFLRIRIYVFEWVALPKYSYLCLKYRYLHKVDIHVSVYHLVLCLFLIEKYPCFGTKGNIYNSNAKISSFS